MTPAELEPVARRHLDPATRVLTVERGPAGNGQETWFASVATPGERDPIELVVRRTAEGGTLAWTDRRQEFETMRAVSAAGLPVPEVLWFEEAGGALARSNFAMRRMPGGPVAGSDAAAVAFELGARLAELHRLPVPAGAPAAAAATRAELARWRERHAECGEFGPPIASALFDWLESHPPALAGPARLLWGDPGPHNLLVESGRITAMLDWEMTHLGHPLDDLAVAMWSCLGVMPADAVVAGYEAAAGGPVDGEALRWFRVLAALSRSVAIVQGVRDFVAGSIDSPVVAGLGWELLSASLLTAAQGAGWPSVEAPALVPTPAAGLRPSVAEAVLGVARMLSGIRVEAPRDRRMLKAAVALLRAAAERERLAAATGPLRGGAGEESLLSELLAERQAFGPLRDLFGPTATPPPIDLG